jgi:ribosomal protein L37E/DNA-binding CsgD family transcriptional regulator
LLNSAYLTTRQLEIWDLNRRGRSRAEIGQRFEFTRQAVYDALKVSTEKVDTALRQTAEASSIEVIRVDPKNGILLGQTPIDSSRVIITFSRKHGIQTWHFEEPDCAECGYTKRCTERLIDEAKERDVEISEDQRKLPPSKLAHIIFSKLIPELRT